MMYLVDKQPLFTGAMSAFDYSYSLEQKFKFITKYGDEVNMSHREGNILYVPRNSAPLGASDYRITNTPVPVPCTFKPRHEEQARMIPESLALLNKGISHVFKAPTGWGKSVAGAAIACMLGQNTMIVVNKQDLMDSWHDALVNALKVDPKYIGKVQQNTCDWQGKRIVLGMAHSLCIPDRYPSEMYKYFGLLEIDEVDQTPTEFFSALFRLFPAKYRLGLSATTDRKDGKWQVVEQNIGKVMVQGTQVPMKPKILVKQTGWKIPRRKVYKYGEVFEEPIPYTPGRMTHVIKAMAGSDPRNMQIVEFVKAAYGAGRRTLILSDLIDHLKELFRICAANGIPGDSMGYYIGGMDKYEYEISKNQPIILGTYKMVDRGTNCPIWDSLVLATPRSDVRQGLGRVLRYLDGKKQPVCLDLVDADSIFQNYHRSRLSNYYAVGADIVHVK